MSRGRPAAFLDRDGTLIEDVGYLSDPARVRVFPGVPAALARLVAAGYLIVLVTNQSGIGRGRYDEAAFWAVNDAMLPALGVSLAGIHHCPHGPDEGCACRKPAPGMLLRAAAELDIDLSRSVMIGDKDADALAGLAAGCRAVRIGPGPAPPGAEVAPDLPAAVALVLGEAS